MNNASIFRQLGLPVFQNKVYSTRKSALVAKTGDVELIQCQASGLVYNHLFDPELLTYDEEYQNEQAHSPSFRLHLERVRKLILAHVTTDETGIEIGCGKGYFLEMLSSAGANVLGYDPAYEGTNNRIIKDYFGKDSDRIAPNYVILRHVLEHIPSPWSFIEQLASKCKATTKIYIEVPCFDWIVENNAFYDIFYEHANYFTLDVLVPAFGKVFESGKLFGGQYLYLIADLGSFQSPSHYDGRQHESLPMDKYMETLLGRLQGNGAGLYIWGAGAKGITFSNLLSRRGHAVSGLVDINPAKQGKFAGLSGVRIEAPDDVLGRFGGADLFVMNPVYFAEIRDAVAGRGVNLISVA